MPEAGSCLRVILSANDPSHRWAQFYLSRIEYCRGFQVPSGDSMPAVLLEGEQGMGMMIELSIIPGHHIAIERYQLQHAFQPLSFKTATRAHAIPLCRYEHLQLSTLTATDTGEYG